MSADMCRYCSLTLLKWEKKLPGKSRPNDHCVKALQAIK